MQQEKINITNQQATEFAYIIFQEIKKYINENQEAYDKWCEKEKIDT